MVAKQAANFTRRVVVIDRDQFHAAVLDSVFGLATNRAEVTVRDAQSIVLLDCQPVATKRLLTVT